MDGISVGWMTVVSSVAGVWIHLNVECAGSVWDRLPGDLKSCEGPRSAGDMPAVRCSEPPQEGLFQ